MSTPIKITVAFELEQGSVELVVQPKQTFRDPPQLVAGDVLEKLGVEFKRAHRAMELLWRKERRAFDRQAKRARGKRGRK